MTHLYYELGVLAKAVQFKNLSAAAIHVGLSQPQLSRIIAKLEDELKIILLDRSAKRKSGWTDLAFSLAKLYESSSKRLQNEIQNISNNEMVAELHIGTLEGMAPIAMRLAQECFTRIGIKVITLDIFDLHELEANFLSGNLDMILTSKTPGRQKFKHLIEFGYQHMEKVSNGKKFGVFSNFEYGRRNRKELETFEHVFVSNSLALKRAWLEDIGGTGTIPSETLKGKASSEAEPVLLIGSELLSQKLWKEVEDAIEGY